MMRIGHAVYDQASEKPKIGEDVPTKPQRLAEGKTLHGTEQRLRMP